MRLHNKVQAKTPPRGYCISQHAQIKSTVSATYDGIICWAVSLHHLSFSIYQKLLRNTHQNISMRSFHEVEARKLSNIFTKDVS